MIAALVIVFREMLEMALVVGLLLAATHGMPGCRRWIAAGVVGGLLGALFFGLFMEQMEAAFEGDGEFIFNAAILLLATIMIAWTVFWMGRHGHEIGGRIKQVGRSVSEGSLPHTALAVIALSAVMREGSEAAFFLFGAAQGMKTEGGSMLFGGVLGGGAALAVGTVLYLGLLRIPLKKMLTVSGWLLMLLAAGMASQASWNLMVIDWLPPIVETLWNSSSLLSSESLPGQVLGVLVGYDDEPSGLQVVVFLLVLAIMVGLNSYLKRHLPEGSPAVT